MATCELCGENVNSLFLTKIAAAEVRVCDKCKNLGKNMEPENREFTFRHRLKEEAVKFEVRSDYSSLINSAMQKKKIDVHILARGTNIRDSTLTKYTTNKIKPDIESALKLEKFLNIKLIEEFKNDTYNIDNNVVILKDVPNKTLGDMFEKLQKQIKK